MASGGDHAGEVRALDSVPAPITMPGCRQPECSLRIPAGSGSARTTCVIEKHGMAAQGQEQVQHGKDDMRATIVEAAVSAGLSAIATIPNAGAGPIREHAQQRQAISKADMRATVETAAIAAGIAAIATIPNAGAGPMTEQAEQCMHRTKDDMRATVETAAICGGIAAIATIPNAGAGPMPDRAEELRPEPEPAPEQQGEADARASVMAAAVTGGMAAIATIPDAQVGNGEQHIDRNRVQTLALDRMYQHVARSA